MKSFIHNNTDYIANAFTIPGINPAKEVLTYKGWSNPLYTWNGFQCPVFDKETTERILTEAEYRFRYEGEKLFYNDGEYFDDIEVEHTKAIIDGEEKIFYGLGTYLWTWEIETIEYSTAFNKIKLPLLDFSSAANSITALWDELTEAEKEILAEKYPFTDSFDEAVLKIRKWVDHVRNTK